MLKSFYDLDVGALNDDCYVMRETENGDRVVQQLMDKETIKLRIQIFTTYMQDIFDAKNPSWIL